MASLPNSDLVYEDLCNLISELEFKSNNFLSCLTDKKRLDLTSLEYQSYINNLNILKMYINSLTSIRNRFSNYVKPIIDILNENGLEVKSVYKSISNFNSIGLIKNCYINPAEGLWCFSSSNYHKSSYIIDSIRTNEFSLIDVSRTQNKVFKFQFSRVPTCCGAAIVSDFFIAKQNKGILQKIYPFIEKLITGNESGYEARYSYLIMTDKDREITKHLAEKLGFNLKDSFFNINSGNNVNVFTKVIRKKDEYE